MRRPVAALSGAVIGLSLLPLLIGGSDRGAPPLNALAGGAGWRQVRASSPPPGGGLDDLGAGGADPVAYDGQAQAGAVAVGAPRHARTGRRPAPAGYAALAVLLALAPVPAVARRRSRRPVEVPDARA